MNLPLKEFYVYAYIDPATGVPFYIGKGYGKRAWRHFEPHARRKRSLFYNKLNKMLKTGDIPDVVLVLVALTEAEALFWESFLIFAIGRRTDPDNPGPLCNLTNGGEGCTGMRHGVETRKRLSEMMLGKPGFFTGKTHTDSSRRLMSFSKTDPSPTIRKRMSAGQKRRFQRPAELERLKSMNLGRKHSDETCAKMSESQAARLSNMAARRRIGDGKLKKHGGVNRHQKGWKVTFQGKYVGVRNLYCDALALRLCMEDVHFLVFQPLDPEGLDLEMVERTR